MWVEINLRSTESMKVHTDRLGVCIFWKFYLNKLSYFCTHLYVTHTRMEKSVLTDGQYYNLIYSFECENGSIAVNLKSCYSCKHGNCTEPLQPWLHTISST